MSDRGCLYLWLILTMAIAERVGAVENPSGKASPQDGRTPLHTFCFLPDLWPHALCLFVYSMD
jgi:hypothetical protein